MGYEYHGTSPTDCDELHEASARLCYRSFHRPNPATATNSGYLWNILDHQHYSVLEHGYVSLFIKGVSRGLSHELVRHRHLSFSQVSTRYVDSTEVEAVRHPELSDDEWDRVRRFQIQANQLNKELFKSMRARGVDLKSARGAARSVLPHSTETELVVSGNIRAWREFLQKRLSPSADGEIRLLAETILATLVTVAPNSLQDIAEDHGVVWKY